MPRPTESLSDREIASMKRRTSLNRKYFTAGQPIKTLTQLMHYSMREMHFTDRRNTKTQDGSSVKTTNSMKTGEGSQPAFTIWATHC
jgi:hypothetical protein